MIDKGHAAYDRVAAEVRAFSASRSSAAQLWIERPIESILCHGEKRTATQEREEPCAQEVRV